MFGYIKPATPELKVKQAELYQSIYCGLCKTQRRRTGLFSCFTLSYDFVFLYLFRAELCQVQTTSHDRKTTFFHPDKHRYAAENDLLIYCAGCAALLNYYKLKDNAADESTLNAFFSKLILPYFKHSLKKVQKRISLPIDDIKNCANKLTEMEKDGNFSPDEMADCSAFMLSAIFSHGIEDELLSCAAGHFGHTVGRWLYLLDAADDFEEDRKKGRYNPFAGQDLRKDDLKSALDALLNDADILLEKIPRYNEDYRAILKNTLFYGMNNSATNALFSLDSKQNSK